MPSTNGKWGLIETIGNRMVKGHSGSSRIIAPPRFRLKYDALITLIVPSLPRGYGGTIHSSVGAVVCKAAILYGLKAVSFANAIKHCKFDGKNDPAHALYKYIQHRHSTKDVYVATVAACKAYCERKKIKVALINSPIEDVFEWNKKTWEPKNVKAASKNTHRKSTKRRDPQLQG